MMTLSIFVHVNIHTLFNIDGRESVCRNTIGIANYIYTPTYICA